MLMSWQLLADTPVRHGQFHAGTRDGDEVVQVYLAKPGDRANPVLAGFRRVHLKAGASALVTVEIGARAQSQVDPQGIRKIMPGVYTVHVGGGRPNYVKAVAARMIVKGEIVLSK